MSASISTPRPLVRFATAAIAAVLLAAGSVALATPASAHDALVASDPAADSTVEALPAQLTLTFSDAIDPTETASEVQVTDAAGTSLTAGPPVAQDNVLTQPLEGTASGVVTVLWKVVSSDTHAVSGEFSFTVAAPEPSPTPTEVATPTPTPTPTPTDTATPTPSAPPVDEGSGDVWPWVIGGLVVAVIAAIVYLVVSRSRREKRLAEQRAKALGGDPAAGSEPPADR